MADGDKTTDPKRNRSPAAEPYDTEDIKRINDVIANARPTWFALLGTVVFSVITLLSVRDIDFFAANQGTKLPLVNIDVPVKAFFLAGSALLTAVYVYLHLYLEFLWTALGRAEPRYEGDPVAEHIVPWQVAEWGLRHRDRLRERLAGRPLKTDERSSSRRDLSAVSTMMTIMFVWLIGPLVLFYFWWRSMPAHIWYLSLITGWLFMLSCWICYRSARRADTLLASSLLRRSWRTIPLVQSSHKPEAAEAQKETAASDAPPSPSNQTVRHDWNVLPIPKFPLWITIAAAFVFAGVSAVRTGTAFCSVENEERASANISPIAGRICRGFVGLPWPIMAVADLSELRIVEQPKNWKDRDEAERDFRADWAKREGVPYSNPFPTLAARDWEAEFRAFVAGKPAVEPSLDPSDLRARWARDHGLVFSASFPSQKERNLEREFFQAWQSSRRTYLDTLAKPSLDGANLRGANLSQSFLAGAQFRRARLEGADLRFASLEGANLTLARVDGADLREVKFEGVVLSGAWLRDANLRNARLQSVDLSRARIEGANLSAARLGGANLRGARLGSANLRGARFEGADLSGANLGSANLSGARFEGADLRHASLKSADLGGASLEGANLGGALLDRANLFSARFKGADLGNARLESANLAYAWLEGANLFGAKFESADLRYARLDGANLSRVRLDRANFSYAMLFGNKNRPVELNTNGLSATKWLNSALRRVNMEGVTIAHLQDFGSTFADASVKMPASDARPCQWSTETLDDAQFFGRWRGWLEAKGTKLHQLPDELEKYQSIPPPKGCWPP
jgi:uncharacterized protein YjbI with pentapeptide repeats